MHTDINSKFENFINLFKDKFIEDVTEIKTDEPMKKEYEKLIRLYEDFKFFKDKNEDKVHVILLGNFSSGKSSTINSLLNLDSNDGQQTTKQVTDTDITMLVHPENKSPFGLRTNYGSFTIKKKYISHPFLENIILVDTPGSGDLNAVLINRHLDEFIIQSDILLYLFNSHISLTSDDKPVLLAKQKYLSAIEMKFVITNADYFRSSKEVRYVENNLNKDDYELFLTTLIDRIHKIPFENTVPQFSLTPNDFILIDNEEKYGIENLKSYIRNYSSNLSPATKSAIKQFKINSYEKRLSEIKKTFLNKIEKKHEVLNTYFNQAKDNIELYERDVFIANNEQSEIYDKHLKIISASKAEMQSFLRKLYLTSSEYQNVWDDSEITSILNISQFENSLRGKARDYMNESISNIRKNLIPIINDFRNTVEMIKVNEVDVDFEMGFDYSKIKFSPEQSSILSLPETVINKLENVTHSILKKLLDRLKAFQEENELFDARLVKNMPIDKIEEVISTAKQNIETDLRIHFKNVELFHSGVFSINNSGKNFHFKMNENDSEISFSDQEKYELNLYATDTLFPDYEHHISEYKSICNRFRKELENVKIEANLLGPEISAWSGNYFFQPEDSSLDELKSLYNEIASRVKSVFINIKVEIESKIVDLSNNNNYEMNKLKTERKKLLISYSILSLILFLISFFLRNKVADNSVSSSIFVNVFSESIWSFLTLISGFIHSYYRLNRDKKMEVDSITNTKSAIMRELEVKLDKLYADMNLEHDGILHIYRDMISTHFTKVKFEEKLLPKLYMKLSLIKNKAKLIADENDSHVETLCNKFKDYFTFEEYKLLKISEKIKTKSIEPPMNKLKLEVSNFENAKASIAHIYIET